jgi:HD-GYP domain-containing protein (c-di-GMP phosphodiesterase class II)
MKEYKEKFIWNKFIEKLKKDSIDKLDKEISEMIIDSSDEDNDGTMPKYNSLYNDNFLDDNDMILDD